MRLHRLELAAFGPFAGHVTVDLDALAADGLFLLHGETGAGKTTLLDAVAYALYGKVPGARGEVKRLRCDRADPGTRTEVTLELTVAGRRMVITRSPEYQRPKSRGSGMTTQKQSVTLRWIGASPDSPSAEGLTRAEEVGQVVVDLLGMSADQFFQVVLLPQGEFARFLRADTAEREVLLERLFDTGRFKSIEEHFAALRRDANASIARAEAVADRQLARVMEAAGKAVDQLNAGVTVDASSGDGSVRDHSVGERGMVAAVPIDGQVVGFGPQWLAALGALLSEEAGKLSAEADQARAERDSRRTDLDTAAARDAALGKLIQLRQEEAYLQQGAAEHAARAGALAAAGRATVVTIADRAAGIAAEAERAAESAATTAAAAVPEGYRPDLGVVGTHDLDIDTGLFSLDEDGSPFVPQADAVVIRKAAADARERAGSLAVMAESAAEQQSELDRLAALHPVRSELDAELATVEAQLVSLPAARAAATAALAAGEAASSRVPSAASAVERAADALAAARSLARSLAELRSAKAGARDAVDAHQSAVDDRQALVERRVAGMAGELAAALSDGRPCVVCGSPSHPAPAAAGADPVDADAVSAAVKRERELAAARTTAESAIARLGAEVAAARAAAHGMDESQARAAWEQVVTTHASEVLAAEGVASAREMVDALAVKADGLGERRTVLLSRLEGVRSEMAQLVASTAEGADRLASAAAPFETVSEHRDHLVRVATALSAWADAAQTLDQARAVKLRADQELDKAVVEAGFADLAAAREAAALDVPATAAAVRDYDNRLAAISTMLADPDLVVDGPQERPDLDVIAALAADADQAAQLAASAADAAQARCHQVAVAARRLEKAWRDLEPLQRHGAKLSALADTIAGHGQNHRALSLRSYVLAARLQQVAGVAGQRLRRMSGGRYGFVYSDARESRGKSGGLGLDIMDDYSGMVRPAKTLSGGESFLASLSLALGLADVVAAESGGRMLDTIFIDEGFGSLDSDTLDLVMATLDELREGGRVVGLVSHVDELRQRIPSRLRVRKTPQGSSVDVTGG